MSPILTSDILDVRKGRGGRVEVVEIDDEKS